MPGYHWWERGFYGVGPEGLRRAGRQPAAWARTEWLSTRRTLELLPGVQPRGPVGRRALLGRPVRRRAPGAAAGPHGGGARRAAAQPLRGDRPAARRRARCAALHRARRRKRRRGHAARALRRQRRRRLGRRRARHGPRARRAGPRRRWWRPARACTWSSTAPSCPAAMRCWCPRPPTAACCSPCPGWARPILGTTDTPRHDLAREPAPVRRRGGLHPGRVGALPGARAAARRRALGLGRPAAAGQASRARTATDTKALSREHTVLVGRSGLVTVTGGKWTTYRAMAEDVLERCMARGLLERRPGGVTERLPLLGSAPGRPLAGAAGRTPLRQRGRRAAHACPAPTAGSGATPNRRGGLSEAMVRFAVRHEMARESRTCWRGAAGCCSWTPPRRHARPTRWRPPGRGNRPRRGRHGVQGAGGAVRAPALKAQKV